MNENDPYQSSQKSDIKCITHDATEMPSRATLSSSTNPKPISITEKSNDETQQIEHTSAAPGGTIDDRQMNPFEEPCVDIKEDETLLQNKPNHGKDESVHFCHDDNGSNSNEREVLPINERINHGDCHDLANFAAAVSHDPTHDGRKRRSLKRQHVKRPAGLLDVIEILDDVDDECSKSKSEQLGSSRTDSIDKSNVIQSNEKESNKSNQTRRKRKLSPSVTRSSSESTLKEAEVIVNQKKAKKKTIADKTGLEKKVQKSNAVCVRGSDVEKKSKTSGGKKLCYACSTCKCEGRSNADTVSHIFPELSGSVARQEQSLVNRLQRIERDIAWREGQRYDVARALKKHQLQMLKRYAVTNTIDQKPRFLPDADMTDNLMETCPSMSLEATSRAKSRVFGKKTHQPTLTQIMRGSKDDNDDESTDENPSTSETDNTVMIDSNCMACATVNDDDFLSFWADTAPIDSSQRHGNMNYYADALAKFNDAKNIGKWAQATASAIQLEEDEGFGALVDLFDSMVGCNCDSTNDDDNDDDDNDSVGDTISYTMDPLTPRGEQVATEIVNSVKKDPEKKAAIERMCPNWKENIEFVQAQTDPHHLQTALRNVQLAKAKLESMKDRVLRAFLDRQNTLDMFERSLGGSIDRLRHGL